MSYAISILGQVNTWCLLIFCILCLTQSQLNMDVQLPLGRINLENLVENEKGEVKGKKVSKKLLIIEKTVRQAPVVLVQRVAKAEVYALCSNID